MMDGGVEVVRARWVKVENRDKEGPRSKKCKGWRRLVEYVRQK